MPVFAYFVVVGSFLLGLLYVAEAQLGPSTALSISTNFHGLPAPYKSASVRVLTAQDAPAPEIAKAPEMAKAPEIAKTAAIQPAASPAAPANPAVLASSRKPKKSHKTVRHTAGPNLYASGGLVIGKNHRVW